MSESFFQEASKDFDPSQLTEEQRAAFESGKSITSDEETKTVMEGGEIRAAYKIEVTFDKNRTVHGPNAVLIQVWESGKHFHGGGDDLMYWCKDFTKIDSWENSPGCGGLIPSASMRGGLAVCPHCYATINSDYVTGQRLTKISTNDLATLIEKIFHQLKSNADVYCKYHKTDIRYIACEQTYGEEKARWLKGMFIYPLKNILRDTSNGSSLHGRLKALFSA